MAVVKRADFDAASEGAGESIVEYGKKSQQDPKK